MAARDLCALSDVLGYVPGYTSVTAIDTQLGALITSQSTDVYEDTSREFTPRVTNPSTRLFEIGEWEREQREVLIGDLASTSGLTITILGEDDTVLQTLDSGAYRLLPLTQDRDAWDPITSIELRRVAATPSTPAALGCGYQLQVAGTWGFPSVPPNVTQAVAKLVIVRYVNDIGANPDGSADGDAFMEAAAELNIGAMYASATSTLNRYRVPVLG